VHKLFGLHKLLPVALELTGKPKEEWAMSTNEPLFSLEDLVSETAFDDIYHKVSDFASVGLLGLMAKWDGHFEGMDCDAFLRYLRAHILSGDVDKKNR
jgi:hypothetical protein